MLNKSSCFPPFQQSFKALYDPIKSYWKKFLTIILSHKQSTDEFRSLGSYKPTTKELLDTLVKLSKSS